MCVCVCVCVRARVIVTKYYFSTKSSNVRGNFMGTGMDWESFKCHALSILELISEYFQKNECSS